MTFIVVIPSCTDDRANTSLSLGFGQNRDGSVPLSRCVIVSKLKIFGQRSSYLMHERIIAKKEETFHLPLIKEYEKEF